MAKDPKPIGRTGRLDEFIGRTGQLDAFFDGSDFVDPISKAPVWRLGPFKVALFYTTAEMAEMLNVDPSTLRRWRRQNPPRGPKATRITARSWRYYHADFIEWLNEIRLPMDAA